MIDKLFFGYSAVKRFLNIEPWSPLAPPKAGKHRMMKSLRRGGRVAPSVYKIVEYLIQNSTLDVRCSMFIAF